MPRLCLVKIKNLAKSISLLLAYLIPLIDCSFGLELDRSLTNGHQNGPLRVLLTDFDSTPGLVYDPSEELPESGDETRKKVLKDVKMSAKVYQTKDVARNKENHRAKLKYDDEDDDLEVESESKKDELNKSQKPVSSAEKEPEADDEERERLNLINQLKPLLAKAKLHDLRSLRKKEKPKRRKFVQKGHKKHGWRNYYHKEEVGEKSKYHNSINDKDWKSKFSSFYHAPIKSMSASYGRQKTRIVVGQKGNQTRSTKRNNGPWRSQNISNYDTGNGIELAIKNAKVAIDGREIADLSKSTINKIKKPKSAVKEVDSRTHDPIKIETSGKINKDKKHVLKRLRVTPKIVRIKDMPFQGHTSFEVPPSWLLPQPFLDARSRVIKAFLKGDI